MLGFMDKAKVSFESRSDDMQMRTFWRILVPILLFDAVVTVLAVIMIYPDDDVCHYYHNISDLVDNHLVPYKDYVFEYPPFTLIVFLIPKLLSWNLDSFRFSFCIFAALFYCLFAHFTIKLTDRFGIRRFYAMAFILLMILFSHEFAVARNDIFAVALVTVSMYLFLEKRYNASACVLALAAMIKIYPVILVPVFAMVLMSRRELRQSFIFIIVAAAVCLLTEIPFLISDPGTAFAYLTYHSDRGLQVEGVVSSFILIADMFVPIVDSISVTFGSSALNGAVPDAIAGCLGIIQVIAVAAVMAWMLYRIIRNSTCDRFRCLAMMSLITIMVFILFSKVYSAQYMLWMLALIPFLFIDHHHDDRLVRNVLIFGLLSLASSAVAFSIGVHLDSPVPTVIVFLKNIAHIVLTVQVLRLFSEATDRSDPKAVHA